VTQSGEASRLTRHSVTIVKSTEVNWMGVQT
jgi:hypothetical protein